MLLGKKEFSGVSWGCLFFFYLLLLLCLCYLAVGLLYRGSQRGCWSWLLECRLSSPGYIYGELFYFANSKTSSSSASLKVTLRKEANGQMVWFGFGLFIFNYCSLGSKLGRS